MILNQGLSRAAALLLTNPTAWVAFPGLNAKLTETAPIQARTEQNANVARLRGIAEGNAETIKITESLFTLPVAARPKEAIEQYFPTSAGLAKVLIEANGKIFPRAEIAGAVTWILEGITIRLS